MKHAFDSDADHRLWRLRYQCRWPMRRIARRFGVSEATISRRLKRLKGRFGLTTARQSPRLKPRAVRPFSLSNVFNL